MGQGNSLYLRPKKSWMLCNTQAHNIDKSLKSIFNVTEEDNKNIVKNIQQYEFHESKLNEKINNIPEMMNKILEEDEKKNELELNVRKYKLKNNYDKVKRTISEPNLASRESVTPNFKNKHKRKKHKKNLNDKFQYDINDLDLFLTKASIDEPANIPIVISFPSILYKTQYGGMQDEISLPLGTILNSVFKKKKWLYVQTAHGEEGYVDYSVCLPFGILPKLTTNNQPQYWQDTTDIFPKPLGNVKNIESKCGDRSNPNLKLQYKRNAVSVCGETSMKNFHHHHHYQRAVANKKILGKRQTLLSIQCDYSGIDDDNDTIKVNKGDVVVLINDQIENWFLIRTKDGREGFIPAVIANHGFI